MHLNTQYKKAHEISEKNPNPMFSVICLFQPVMYRRVYLNKFACGYRVVYKSLNTLG